MYRYTILLIFVFTGITSYAQTFQSPLDIPILLSANFGELRPNHFHSGLDLKTQGSVGKTVRAPKEGYISRISVSPYGYGNALYLTHPDGTTTVYGHLLRFSDSIAAYVKDQQYKQETFRIDLTPAPEQFPVKAGQKIASSGNSGSSGGPHLHFEVRDTKTEEPLDPLDYFKEKLIDTKPPRIYSIMIYPLNEKGIINGTNKPVAFNLTPAKNGMQTVADKITAWGEIGVAVKAYDYMDNTTNIYGVKEVRLTADTTLLFHSCIERFAFHEGRYINSLIDYATYREKGSLYMKCFVEPGNRLRFIESNNDGVLVIDQPRNYKMEYQLTDAFGNKAVLHFDITGKEEPIPTPDSVSTELFRFYSDNRFGAKGIRLTVPKGSLYTHLRFLYSAKEDSTGYADIHALHTQAVPLHKSARLSLRILRDTLTNTEQYGIAKINKNYRSWVGGTYRNGWIDADINELGKYTVVADKTAPQITPIDPANWLKTKKFTFKISDNLSGIATYKGCIDGQFALFELDGKTASLTYKLDRKRVAPGTHVLTLVVTDGCGNQSAYTHNFTL